jgi:hypothetical protein
MEKNVGKVDAYVRYGVAAVLAIVALTLGTASSLFVPLILGAVVLSLTGAVGRCGLYKLIGVNTCPLEQRK